MITEDGLSITSRSGPQCWPHTLKLEIVRRLGAALNQLNMNENKAEALRETSQQVALQHVDYTPGVVIRSNTRWSLKSESYKTFVKELATLIQYGAQLRSQFQDTNMEVSRLPLSLKVAQ